MVPAVAALLVNDLVLHASILEHYVICYCENGEFFTCTQRLQQWNKPRGKKLDSMPVTDLKEHKITLNVCQLESDGEFMNPK